MRSPEHRQVAPPRAGRQFEDELQLHYLAPGAFTVLPPERRHPPDPPPPAPEPYRLTPGTKRHKQPSFAIIGDIDPSSTPASGCSSPTGRVSPFKGRGFNPIGSRHASRPASPEDARRTAEDARRMPEDTRRMPENARGASANASPSRIPLPQKKGGLGERGQRSGAGRRIGNKLSQSLTDLEAEGGQDAGRSSRRHVYDKATGFQRLSPIIGSSPEPSQSMSSPSRIPRSQSTPPSRKPSPSRYTSPASGKPPLSNSSVVRSRSQSRIRSRNASRNPSRTASREASPTKTTTSPSRIPLSKYKNVQAKVDSNNKPKPKVLPKPEVSSEQSDSEPAKSKLRTPSSRKESFSRMRTDSRPNLLPKTGNYSKNNNNSTSDSSVGASSARDSVKGGNNKNNASIAQSYNNNVIKKGNIPKRDQVTDKTTKEATTNSDNSKSVHVNSKPNDSDTSGARNDKDTVAEAPTLTPTNEVVSKPDIGIKPDTLPSTATAVSSTTSTVAKPLKIETNLCYPDHVEKPKPRSPMIDGRVLSATSVSNAMNKMNDTVLDTQTLMRDRGFSKLSPAANAVISVANEANKANNAALDTKNATTALPTVEPLPKTTPKSNKATNNGHAKQIEHVLSSKALELEVQKHMQKLITPERKVGSNGRSVVTSDVQPIQITVREKPSDAEVQSGNIRPVINVSNGITERPGLPPGQATPPNEPEKEPPPQNACTKLLASCRGRCCSCCSANKTKRPADKTEGGVGCFACLKKKPAPARIIIENEMGKKPGLLDRFSCCKSQKVGDKNCFAKGKRKESWAERRDSILSVPTPPKSNSKNFMRKMFCLDHCCKRKGIEEIVRKPSIVSKKKSLTPTTAPPPEDPSPKIDLSLVEHSSHMKAAIPILPICLAWFCLVMNCIAPGSGTIFSGIFCLCLGIPRFSQKDGARPRIGSFLINIIIGIGQFFTVLFCLVGWGWSIWWGVIMLKIAKKHKKFKHLEAIEQASSMPSINPNNREINKRRT